MLVCNPSARVGLGVYVLVSFVLRVLKYSPDRKILPFCDRSVREKVWRSRKHVAQVTAGELAAATRLPLRQAFERMHTLFAIG